MDRKQAFDEAFAAYVPADDDPPANVPFYAAFAALRVAWGEAFVDKYNYLAHRAAVASGLYPNGGRYETAVAELQASIPSSVPEAPRPSYWLGAVPVEPTEQDARHLFNEQFKIAFPGKRANSKLANEHWLDKADKARAIVRARYEDAMAEYRRKEASTEARNAEAHEAWMTKVQGQALMENAIREIVG